MEYRTIKHEQYPYLLKQISGLPRQMHVAGPIPPDDNKFLCVIGARRYSDYGKEACHKLIQGLRGYPIVIISGMAIGIDSLSHEAAIDAGLKTIAFPGSGLNDDVIYPQSKRQLVRRILESGNTIMSPFRPEQDGTPWTFPVRNRLMAGMSHATLIIEARRKSGTMLTARDALGFGRDVLVVPGSIFSDLSYGPHSLWFDGATPVSNSEDILEALGFEVDRSIQGPQKKVDISTLSLSPDELLIVKALEKPVGRDDLIRSLAMPTSKANVLLIGLELRGIVRESRNVIYLV